MSKSPRRIDVHHHYIPPDYGLFLREKGIRPGGIPLPRWAAPMASKVMAANGVETAVVSVSTPGVWFGDVTEARHWARRVNEFGAALVADNPRGFGFFATLTLPDVDGALVEAAYALDVLKADGIVLLANNAGIYLGDPALRSCWPSSTNAAPWSSSTPVSCPVSRSRGSPASPRTSSSRPPAPC